MGGMGALGGAGGGAGGLKASMMPAMMQSFGGGPSSQNSTPQPQPLGGLREGMNIHKGGTPISGIMGLLGGLMKGQK